MIHFQAHETMDHTANNIYTFEQDIQSYLFFNLYSLSKDFYHYILIRLNTNFWCNIDDRRGKQVSLINKCCHLNKQNSKKYHFH